MAGDCTLMKLVIWVAGILAGLGVVLCGVGYFNLEPQIFEMGLRVTGLGVAVALTGLFVKWFQNRQRQTVACVQCGINQQRHETRFGRCRTCRDENRRQAMIRAAAEKERRRELARVAEEIRAQQQRSKFTAQGKAAPPVVVAPREGGRQVVQKHYETYPAQTVAHYPDNIARCPRCQSPSVQLIQRGYSAGAGTVGCCLIGPAGMLLGAFGASQADRHCINCRYKW